MCLREQTASSAAMPRLSGAWPNHAVGRQRRVHERECHTMSFAQSIIGALAATAILVTPAVAQNHGVSLFASGGGFNGLTNLDAAGTRDFKKVGYTIGGGVAVEAHRYVSLRGDFTYARNASRIHQTEPGPNVDRFF